MNSTFQLFFRFFVIVVGFVLLWQGGRVFFSIPDFLLPSPLTVLQAMKHNASLLQNATETTFIETLIGLVSGCIIGMVIALLMIAIPLLRRWLMPLIIISQSIPTFALAPLLVLWFGFGIKSKIVMAIIMIFFPVTSAFFDGLNQTQKGWLALSQTMNATFLRRLFFLRFPAALPSFASGLRIATAIAPIGAVVGEWVGASSGLGFVMLTANSRFQTDLMFAALIILSLMTISLWSIVSVLTKKLIFWSEIEQG
ncbi:Riboflavin transport system permease protein RibX [Commensalibacter sp. Nvir]|uniref:ABC transporter permease n=1 Tax=Commensalibacter sp. Nvir TaxID=3069817 RepID=UPI002D39603D|nr:Riboflavin transport system permease protein RibX [Commensalibacter sp. Nvir]